MKRLGLIFFILSSALLYTGCTSTGFLMAKASVILFSETYPPKDTDAKIDIYLTLRPSQEYIEFAQIKCKTHNDKWSFEQITKKAREIGADGVIIIGVAGSSGVGTPLGNSTYVVSEPYGITAIAIKYK